jgi:hypothetical protein
MRGHHGATKIAERSASIRAAIAGAGAAAIELLKAERWPFASFTDDIKIVELLEGYAQEDANLLRVEGEELTINILATLLIFSLERRAW